jgi:hypothetical protein
MDAPRLGWPGRLLLLGNWFSLRLSRRRAAELEKLLGREQFYLLHKRVEMSLSGLPTSQVPTEIVQSFFSAEAMLSHPLLIHYIRPAIRMAAAARYDISGIPVITSPTLTFGGEAVPLGSSGLKVAEIPLAVVFLLRELGRAIVNLHQAIEYNQPDRVQIFARACGRLSTLIYEPAPIAFYIGQNFFRKTSSAYKLFSAQASQVLAVFLILHEMGHIFKNHALPPRNDDQRRDQEHDADKFAMHCELAPKRDEVRFEPFRKLQMIYICNLFTLMERELKLSGIPLNGYPSFEARRAVLLEHFQSTRVVRNSVARFEQEVGAIPVELFDRESLKFR